jgi:hypothetical protein
MPEVKYIAQAEKSILLMDFSRIEDPSVLPGLVDEAIRLAHSSNAQRSVLALIDMSGTRITKPVIDSVERLSRNNGPFIKAIVFVGLSASWSLLVSMFLRTSGRRNHKVMQDRDQAIRWLVLQ